MGLISLGSGRWHSSAPAKVLPAGKNWPRGSAKGLFAYTYACSSIAFERPARARGDSQILRHARSSFLLFFAVARDSRCTTAKTFHRRHSTRRIMLDVLDLRDRMRQNSHETPDQRGLDDLRQVLPCGRISLANSNSPPRWLPATRIAFRRRLAYTMVRRTWFNGVVQMPSIAIQGTWTALARRLVRRLFLRRFSPRRYS